MSLSSVSQMRVIQIVSSISDEASGPTYVVKHLCESLIKRKHNVTLLTLDWAPIQSPPAYLNTFPLGYGPRKLGRSPQMKRWLDEKARSREMDIIHSHGLWMMPNVYPGKVARKCNVPYVVSPHGVFTEHSITSGSAIKPLFLAWVQKPVLMSVSCFHALSEQEYIDIRRQGFTQPIAIVPNAINIPKQVKLSKQKKAIRTVLFLGRIHPQKGLDVLLNAWSKVQGYFANWRLLIVGPDEGGHLVEMQNLANRIGCQRVKFIGPLYGEEKYKAYNDADLFVLSSYSEGLPMTVLEALACETPVIVTKASPFDNLESEGAGWWVDIGVDPLVNGFEKALTCSDEELLNIGLRGRAWMERDYSWQRIGQQMEETYRWLCDKTLPVPSWIKLD
jgi:glycosyltransferase involved in cell wall biosynthesis